MSAENEDDFTIDDLARLAQSMGLELDLGNNTDADLEQMSDDELRSELNRLYLLTDAPVNTTADRFVERETLIRNIEIERYLTAF